MRSTTVGATSISFESRAQGAQAMRAASGDDEGAAHLLPRQPVWPVPQPVAWEEDDDEDDEDFIDDDEDLGLDDDEDDDLFEDDEDLDDADEEDLDEE